MGGGGVCVCVWGGEGEGQTSLSNYFRACIVKREGLSVLMVNMVAKIERNKLFMPKFVQANAYAQRDNKASNVGRIHRNLLSAENVDQTAWLHRHPKSFFNFCFAQASAVVCVCVCVCCVCMCVCFSSYGPPRLLFGFFRLHTIFNQSIRTPQLHTISLLKLNLFVLKPVICQRTADLGITKTRLFKYTENLTTKKWKFSDKKNLIFLIFLLKT